MHTYIFEMSYLDKVCTLVYYLFIISFVVLVLMISAGFAYERFIRKPYSKCEDELAYYTAKEHRINITTVITASLLAVWGILLSLSGNKI